MADMMTVLLLLVVLMLSSVAPAPVSSSDDVMKMKSKVKWMCELLLVRINKDLQVPPRLTSPVDNMDALTSIMAALDGYNGLLSETLAGSSQIRWDVSSLAGFLHHWGAQHCHQTQTKPSASAPIQKLKKNPFRHTVTMETISRLKTFLNQLINNLDTLEKC